MYFLVAILLRVCVAKSWPLPLPSQVVLPVSTTFWIAVANVPALSAAAYNDPSSVDDLDQTRSLWNPRKQSSTLGRRLKLGSRLTDPGVNTKDFNSASISTEAPTTEENSPNDKIDDNNNNDDVQVVVPLNFAMGENIDDKLYTEEETAPNGNDGDITNSSQIGMVYWTCGAAVIFSVAGYMIHRRRRDRSRWREYRTHRILQEHVEAFDLSFQDEDDVELSDF